MKRVRAIANLPGDAVRPALQAALADADPLVLIDAANALNRFGDPAGEKAVAGLLSHADAVTRGRAAGVLASIATKDAGLPALDKAAAAEKDEGVKGQMLFSARQARARLGLPEPETK